MERIFSKNTRFEKANIRAICKAAGVTNGAFYGHFEDKEVFLRISRIIVNQIQSSYAMYEDKSLMFIKEKPYKERNHF